MKRSRVIILATVLVGSLLLAGSLWGAAPGDMVWPQPQIFSFPNCDTIMIGAVAASTNRLIVCGTAFKHDVDTGDIGFIKAFDQATGNPIWEKLLNTGENRNSFNSLSVVGNTLVVEGYSSSYTLDQNFNYIYSLNQTTLWAYKSDTGESLWGPISQNAAPMNIGPINMTTANNKVFVVRKEQGYNQYRTTGNCIVEAYQVGATSVPAMSLLLE